MGPNVDIRLDFKRENKNNHYFTHEPRVKVETRPPFEKVCDFEQIRGLEPLVYQPDEYREKQVENRKVLIGSSSGGVLLEQDFEGHLEKGQEKHPMVKLKNYGREDHEKLLEFVFLVFGKYALENYEHYPADIQNKGKHESNTLRLVFRGACKQTQ